jgi:hypothetical protein
MHLAVWKDWGSTVLQRNQSGLAAL